MPSIRALLSDLDERTIARRIGVAHDEARMSFPLRTSTVRSFDEYTAVIAEYVRHHYGRCVSRGGHMSRSEAAGRGKNMLNQELRRQGGDFVSAYRDCEEGVNGGLRHVLDILCESIKAEGIEYYTRDAFDRHIPPHDWRARKDMVGQFIGHCGVALPGIDRSDPARYARDVEELIGAFLRGLRQTSSIFRRL